MVALQQFSPAWTSSVNVLSAVNHLAVHLKIWAPSTLEQCSPLPPTPPKKEKPHAHLPNFNLSEMQQHCCPLWSHRPRWDARILEMKVMFMAGGMLQHHFKNLSSCSCKILAEALASKKSRSTSSTSSLVTLSLPLMRARMLPGVSSCTAYLRKTSAALSPAC